MNDIHNQIVDRRAVVGAVEDSFGVGDVWDAEIINDSYSGRGMYGATCFALVGTHKEFMKFVAALAYGSSNRPWDDKLDEDAITELIDAAKFDSMGLETVMYFPGWSLSD